MKVEIDDFWSKIEEILGPQITGQTIGRGRWRRGAGSGRFHNRGIIRFYNANCIHIIFHNPNINHICNSVEETVNIIKNNII